MKRSEKHLFRMLAGGKWSPIGRTFDSGVTSVQIFEVERSGSCVMIYSPGTDLLLNQQGSDLPLKEPFLFLRRLYGASSDAFDLCYVETADNSLDLFLDRHDFEYFVLTHESHDPGADLSLYHRDLRTS